MKSVTIRVPDELANRVQSSIDKAGCTKTEWWIEAGTWACERDEAKPIPKAVLKAMPRRSGTGMIMPEGVTSRFLP